MSETPLNKLKNKGLDCATAVLTRVDLALEEAKLRKCFVRLGKKFHGTVRNSPVVDVRNDRALVELLGEIEERMRTIKKLKNHENKE